MRGQCPLANDQKSTFHSYYEETLNHDLKSNREEDEVRSFARVRSFIGVGMVTASGGGGGGGGDQRAVMTRTLASCVLSTWDRACDWCRRMVIRDACRMEAYELLAGELGRGKHRDYYRMMGRSSLGARAHCSSAEPPLLPDCIDGPGLINVFCILEIRN